MVQEQLDPQDQQDPLVQLDQLVLQEPLVELDLLDALVQLVLEVLRVILDIQVL